MSILMQLLIFVCVLHLIVTESESCNEDVCGSIVSKCILTQSCKCEAKDLSCYKDCVRCMGRKYFEKCCGCVDLCAKKPIALKPSLSQKSHVEDFEGVPELFDVLVSSPADELEYSWNIFTFPIDFQTVVSSPSNKIYKKPVVKEDNRILSTINCTVVYFDQCVSWNKCRQNCRSTGASSYRWFHDGCCECVGSTCINYGVNESRCKYCPEEEDEHDDEWNDNEEEDDLYVFEIFDGNLKDNTI